MARGRVDVMGEDSERWYGIVGTGDREDPAPFCLELERSEEALCVFEPPEKGAAYVNFKALRPGWRALAYPASEIAEIIERAENSGVQYVVVNPPWRESSLKNARIVRIRAFLGSLRERGN